MASVNDIAARPGRAERLERLVDTECANCEHFPDDLLQTADGMAHNERLASLGALIAGIAHELSNPTAYIRSNLKVLQNYGDRLKRYIAAVDRGASDRRLASLREQLAIDRVLADLDSLVDGSLEGAECIQANVLSLGRYATPRVDDACRYDLCAAVKTALSWVNCASSRSVHVTCDMPAELKLCGHGVAVHQVLVNLLRNAIDAMEGVEAALVVSVDASAEREVAVSVRDTGPGIGEGDTERLFAPFVTSKPPGEGTGLGLAISRQLAEREGGRLEAANHPEGGAVFTLVLPRHACDGC